MLSGQSQAKCKQNKGENKQLSSETMFYQRQRKNCFDIALKECQCHCLDNNQARNASSFTVLPSPPGQRSEHQLTMWGLDASSNSFKPFSIKPLGKLPYLDVKSVSVSMP